MILALTAAQFAGLLFLAVALTVWGMIVLFQFYQ